MSPQGGEDRTGFDLAASLEATARQHAEGCVKTWEDLDRYRRIIAATGPTLIVEAGTFSGKSALWFAANSDAVVVTVDCTDNVDPETRDNPLFQQRVTRFHGSTLDPKVIADVHALAGGHTSVLVTLDSGHSAAHVFGELLAYTPLVGPGSYCVVEDTLVRWRPEQMRPVGPYEGSPYDAVDEWLAAHPEWSLDEDIDLMFPQTQHPGGWLRRAA